jgi:hypothetical protein
MNINEAKQLIDKTGKVAILLIAGDSKYQKVVEEAIKGNPSWSLGVVNILDTIENRNSSNQTPLYFEPDTYPSLFLYDNRSRSVVISRVLELSELQRVLKDIDSGTFELV